MFSPHRTRSPAWELRRATGVSGVETRRIEGRLTGEFVMHARSVVVLATLAASLLAAGEAGAQTGRTHWGPRVTYNFDFEETAIGFHLGLPIASRLDFYPSVDVFLPDEGSLLGLNADIKFQPSPQDAGPLYIGAGINFTRRGRLRVSNTETGLNLFGGLEARTGAIHPFIEMRAIFADQSMVQLSGGLNITMGGR
jgi:hypothetical protein